MSDSQKPPLHGTGMYESDDEIIDRLKARIAKLEKALTQMGEYMDRDDYVPPWTQLSHLKRWVDDALQEALDE